MDGKRLGYGEPVDNPLYRLGQMDALLKGALCQNCVTYPRNPRSTP